MQKKNITYFRSLLDYYKYVRINMILQKYKETML
nr:MAG TPA: hypothetical protein [Caudoviricetes sp.]